jgi:anti-sigma factor RsiW
VTDLRCDQLDEYLCGWLSPEEAASFEAHLADCTACREDCALQRRIDRSLADGNVWITPVPVGLRSRVDCKIRTARRRRMLGWASVIAATAGVSLALGIWATAPHSFMPRDGRETAQHLSGEGNGPAAILPRSEPPVPAAQVSMVDPSSAIVMPVESHRPNVTLVRVYQTFQVSRDGG